ncbi:hypothetical protein IH982_03030 [Patescibacteria group bacterium]|nr:hypothetical protein [Patescibacteria group bacterium]
MRRIVAKISRGQIMQTVPKASLGVLPMLISFELGFALFAGYFAAYFFAGQKTSEQGRIPSLVFDMGDWRVHLHHWLVFLGIFVGAAIASFFIVSPFLFYGFLGGVIVQGLLHYDDWPRIVSKQEKT